MIKILTDQQKMKVREYFDEGLKNGISTETNKSKAENAIRQFYRLNNYKSPIFEWCMSPLEAKQKFNCINPYFLGQMDSYWIYFYLYCRDVLQVKYDKKYSQLLDLHLQVSKSCGWWYPFTNVVVICEKPIKCHMKQIGVLTEAHCLIPHMVLHNEHGMAIKYKDGFGLWNLNGVQVTEEIVMTPAEQLDPKILLREKNVEVRREIVRKIGIERVIQKLGAICIDKKGDYELLLLDLGDGRKREYLKMKNPSIGVYHIEGVPPGTETVLAALKFRNGLDTSPEVLT